MDVDFWTLNNMNWLNQHTNSNSIIPIQFISFRFNSIHWTIFFVSYIIVVVIVVVVVGSSVGLLNDDENTLFIIIII